MKYGEAHTTSPDQIRVLDIHMPIQSWQPVLPSSRELGSLAGKAALDRPW
jgi:hypothetical protein